MVRFIGTSVPRLEDRRILTGRGRYVDDISLPGMLHAAFLRSPVASARIRTVQTTAAQRSPGVVAIFTGEDLNALTPVSLLMAAGGKAPVPRPLATDRVRHVGEPVAMVVAGSRYDAEDACELIEVDFDVLEPVVAFRHALDPGSPPVFEELATNVVYQTSHELGDVAGVFARADRVVEATLTQHRVANCPMEARGAIADFDPRTGELRFHASAQGVHHIQLQLAEALSHPIEKVRVLVADVGGSFGLKGGARREDICLAAASMRLGRPVKWVEDRNEHLVSSGHAREETMEVRAAVTHHGRLLGLDGRLVLDAGAYPKEVFSSDSIVELVRTLLPGAYRLEAYSFEGIVVTTNKCSYGAYRAPWEMAEWSRERLLDLIAAELGIDPVELRRRNLVAGEPGDQMLTGLSLSGVTSRQALDRAVELVDYPSFRRRQAAARSEGRYLGIGFATFIEAAPGPPEWRAGMFGWERAYAKLEVDGHLTIRTSQAPHGQGHETTVAQLVADEMGIPIEHVNLDNGDSLAAPFSITGTGGSRAATWVSGSVLQATRAVKEKVLRVAAEMLEIAPEDLGISDGKVAPRGDPQAAIPLGQIAYKAAVEPTMLPPGTDADLHASITFTGDGIVGSGWSGGTHACIVEVDLSTGRVEIVRYVVVEDCGPLINPAIVEGQVRGGVAQGIGEVLLEHAAYDRGGNFLAGTFMDYLLPTAVEIPEIEIEHLGADPAPDGTIGFRGVGEGGASAAPSAVTNAVADALSPFGAVVLEQYLPPSRVLELAGVVPQEA